jgi:predicted Zn-dependent protease
VSALGLVLAACAGRLEDIGPGGASALVADDEAGIWMAMEQAERQIVTSGQLVDDAALEAYVREVACRVAGPYCEDLRVYVVERPGFNAAMAPNGFMTVWTGLLLRVESEAELAAVLGHEVAHYQRRHSLERWRTIRGATTAAAFFSLGAAAAGFGFAGNVAQLVAMGAIFGFSREQEREADRLGLEKLAAAGYEPEAAANIWRNILDERAAMDEDEPPIFFSTHPGGEERLDTLARHAAALPDEARRESGEARLRAATARHRGAWIESELRRGRLDPLEVVLERLAQNVTDRGEIEYYRGELYRRRGGDGDGERALEAYEKALRHRGAPAEVHRARGLVLWSREHPREAHRAFARYLLEAPGADDAAMVRAYMDQLE